MGDQKILISILFALVYQSHGSKKNPALMAKINQALELIRLPERVQNYQDENTFFIAIREEIDRLMVEGTDKPLDISKIETALKPNRIFFKNQYDTVVEELRSIEAMEIERITEEYIKYHGVLNDYVNAAMVRKTVAQYSYRIRDARNIFQMEDMIGEMKDALIPHMGNGRNNQLSHIVGLNSIVECDDDEQLEEVYQAAEDTYGVVGGLTVDLQGWNIAFGPTGIIPRGVLIEVQALSGRSKSETLRRLCTAICRCNQPQLVDPKRKPMVIYFTLEDTQAECWLKMFQQLWCEENDAQAPADWTNKQRREYVQSRLSINGIKFIIVHMKKNIARPEDIIGVMEYYQELGYEIIAQATDYMGLVAHNHIPADLETNRIQRKHSLIGEFGKRNHILSFVANQLGNIVAYELEEVADEFAKEAAMKNINVGSNRIIDELDARVVVNVVEGDDGKYYHQLAVGKLRWAKGYSRALRYSVYEMHSVNGEAAGFILPDYQGECMVRDATGGPLRSAGGGSW